MADARFGRTNRQGRGMRTSPTIDGGSFGAVIQHSSRPVSIDVIYLFGCNSSALAGSLHRGQCGVALRMRLGEVMAVSCSAIADNFCQYIGAALTSIVQCF